MKISNNKVVSLSYELRIDNEEGEIIETVNASRPLMFIYGAQSMIPGFERNLEGLETGDSFAFAVPCEEAYGPATEDEMVEIPMSAFVVDGEIQEGLLEEGNAIPLVDSRGNHLNGVVVEVKEDTVLMDFNHPLAGDDLFFSGTVTNIREATAEELERGLESRKCATGNCGGCGGDSNCDGNCN